MQTVLVFDWHIWLVLLIVLAIIVLDFLVGVLTNLSTFSIQKFPNQLVTFVLPYFTPLLVLAIVQFITPLLNTIGVTVAVGTTFYVFAAGVAAKAVMDIVSKVDQSALVSTKPQVVAVQSPPPTTPAS